MDDWAEQFSDNYSTQDLHNEGVILKNASSWTEDVKPGRRPRGTVHCEQ